jgi:hypothetical protein
MDIGVPRTAREASACKVAFTTNSGSPLLNRTYVARNKVMHHAVDATLRQLLMEEAEVQLVLVGAGLDRSYDKLGATKVFAMDFPAVLEERAIQVAATNHDNDVNHIPVEVDLRDSTASIKKLLGAGFQPECKTLFVSEMVLNYIEQDAVGALVTALLKTTTASSIWISYDLHSLSAVPSNSNSNSQFMQYMIDSYAARDAPLLFLPENNRVQCSQKGSFRGANLLVQFFTALWPCAFARPIHSWLRLPSLTTATEFKNNSLENMKCNKDNFDEFSSLAQLHRHYTVSLFGNNNKIFCDILKKMGINIDTSSKENATHIRANIAYKSKILWNDAANVYERSMAPLAQKHPSVSKFVKLAVKRIRNGYNRDSSSFMAFYIAIIVKKHTKTSNTNDHSSDSSTSTDFAIYPLVHPIHEFNMSTIPENVQVVGTVALRLNPSSNKTIVELSHMSVDEIHRNHGVGSRLLDTALSCVHSHASSSNAIASIELSVMTELVAAIRLYKTKNFIPIGSVEACGTCSLQRMILPLNLK